MSKNNVVIINKHKESKLTQEEVQAEIDSLYLELERRFGPGYAESILRHYTNAKPTTDGGE